MLIMHQLARILFYMDAPGKREELHDMARRLAAVGYFVVLPNLYYRRERDFWLRERTEALLSKSTLEAGVLLDEVNRLFRLAPLEPAL